MKERLQKIISASGYASRRAGEELIKAGRVTVNGETASLGDSADPDTDIVAVDGAVLSLYTDKKYIILNKPAGFVTTLSDEEGRKCVSELVSDVGTRVYPVGRLDMYSEGLLILTNDGEFANSLTHPSGLENKVYHVTVKGKCTPHSLKILRSPLNIDGYVITPAEVEVISENEGSAVLEVTIHEGRNRQIRKMCEQSGLKLIKLVRIKESCFELGGLPSGKWRYITEKELQDYRDNHIK